MRDEPKTVLHRRRRHVLQASCVCGNGRRDQERCRLSVWGSIDRVHCRSGRNGLVLSRKYEHLLRGPTQCMYEDNSIGGGKYGGMHM